MPTTSKDFLIRPVMSNVTGLVEDECVNDFAFRWPFPSTPTTGDLATLMNIVGLFYRNAQSGGQSVGYYISESIDRGATHRIEAIRIDVGGSPVHEIPWLGPEAAGSAQNLPNECAGVLSFHGDLTGLVEEVGVTRPKARRRGRLYIGPLNQVAINDGANPTLTTAFRTTMVEAVKEMRDAAGVAGFDWSVWSRAADELYPVTGGWTDDAPDVQRRRGQAAGNRATFVV